jgi:hypothetical protein
VKISANELVCVNEVIEKQSDRIEPNISYDCCERELEIDPREYSLKRMDRNSSFDGDCPCREASWMIATLVYF